MRILYCALYIIIVVFCQTIYLSHCRCSEVNNFNGTISDSRSFSRYDSSYQKCWMVKVPFDHFVRLKIQSFSFGSQSCSSQYLRVAINETKENYTFCYSDTNRNPVTALNDVTVEVVSEYSGNYRSFSFTMSYEILELQCAFKNSFHCTNRTCIPRSQVCDGVKNCENGADEVGCETGVISVPGVEEARSDAIKWLKSKRTTSWGWRENTARAVTALFLSNAANFNGTNLEEELMAKQTELKTAVALLKNPLPSEELSSFINALLVTCHNPRHFYGQNLVNRLKHQVHFFSNFTHPITYLALCNANETWPDKAVEDLSNIFSSDSDYPFVLDMQAFAVMAISCYANNTNFFHQNQNNMTLLNEYQKIIKRFKNHQLPDGSFGNIHTTSLVTQALISGGQEHARDWKLNATIKYLIKELNSSKIEVYANYLTLPVLNGKSLSDIAKVNCTANPRKHGDEDLVDDVNDYTGPKMRVQYSLFVGDKKDIVHTMSLRVPENYTTYEVMQLAAVEDQKYRFEWKRVSNKMYVYSIGKITNDPEGGKFWLLYLGSTNSTSSLQHYTTSPDEIILDENAHFVMWYRKAAV